MQKTRYKLLVCLMFFLCLIILSTSFAAAADTDLMDGNIICDNSLGLVDSVGGYDDSLGLVDSVENHTDSLNSIDVGDEILESSESDNPLKAKNYYFDSNAAKDGDGTKGNPYKYLNGTRIQDNSVIHLANGVYEIRLPGYYANVTIIGHDASQTIIQGNCKQFEIEGTFILKNLTLKGAEIYNYGDLNASNVIFSNGDGQVVSGNDKYGGAIFSKGKSYSVYLNNCSFYNNSARFGGAIYSDSSKNVRISNCKFINNAAGFGGAIYIFGSNPQITGCEFINNSADMGGALVFLNSSSKVANSYGFNNSASYEGGVIYQIYGSLTVSNSNFKSNNARNGAGLFAYGLKSLSIIKSNFINNSALDYGGAIYSLLNDNTNMTDIVYTNNNALNSDFNDLYNSRNLSLIFIDSNYTMYNYNKTDGNLPKNYSSIAEGYVSPAKDQKGGGNCWAFATIATLESCILKASGIDLDLSEENMKNLATLYSAYGWNLETNSGGYPDMSLGYLLSWLGPVYDSDDTYNDRSFISPVLSSIMHVQNVMFLKRDNFKDNDMIKRAIMDYGAVFTPVYAKLSSIKSDNALGEYKYYLAYNNDTDPNHAVALVGWDDDIQIPGAPGKGAWIAKNSWGSSKGFIYISYFDNSSIKLGTWGDAFTFVLNDTIKYDKNYQYDIAKTDYLYNKTNEVWYKNIFTATDNEYLTAVSTYFEKETNWNLSVYVNKSLKLVQSGFSNPGYWTIDLKEPISLDIGDIFEIVFKIKVKGDAGVPVSESQSLNNRFYQKNLSFISYDGKTWKDLYNLVWDGYPDHTYKSQVACIKAFTVIEKMDTALTLDLDYLSVDGNCFNPVNVTANVLNEYGRPVNGGQVKFNLSDEIVYANVSNGFAKICHIFKKGFNGISAEFVCTAYNSPVVNSSIFITKFDISMDTNISYYFDSAFVNLTLNDTVNETVLFILGYKNFTDKAIDGQLSINLTNLNAGLNNLRIAVYPALYDCNEVEYNFTVDTYNTQIILSDFETVYGNSYNYKIKLIDENGNPLAGRKLEYVLDKTYAGTTDENGEITLRDLKAGNYNLNVTFKGEKLYLKSSNSAKVNIKTTVVLPNYSNYTYNSKYNVKFLDKSLSPLKNANVTIVFAGKSYNLKTDSYGKVIIGNYLKPGTYAVKVKNPETLEEKTHNIKVLARIDQNKNMTMYYGGVSYYKVRAFDDYGRIAKNVSVKFTVNGRNYYMRTNSNGYASIRISGLKPNDYTISATYKGFAVKNKITVKPTIITKNISVKKTGIVKFTAKLVNAKGAILKYKYVSFKFKSKKYKIKTNSKGIATLSLKNLKKGKYAIYSTYGKLTVKNTITIK